MEVKGKWNSCEVDFCISFSLVTQQQQIHPKSPMKAMWSPIFDELPKPIGYLAQRSNVEL